MTHGRAITATPGMLLGALGCALLSPPQTAELRTKEARASRECPCQQGTKATPGHTQRPWAWEPMARPHRHQCRALQPLCLKLPPPLGSSLLCSCTNPFKFKLFVE